MQYLFSVIDDGTGLATPTEEADTDAFNDGLRAEGHWVFAEGLGRRTGHGHGQPGRRSGVPDGPPRDEGVPRRLLGDRGGRSRRRARARRPGVEGLQAEGRGAAIPSEPDRRRQTITRAHQEEWARVVACLTRRFGDLDVAEEAAAEAFATAAAVAGRRRTAQRRRLADHDRQPQGDRPAPARKPARRQAAGGTDDARRRPAQPPGPIEDERLRLVFTCCHPALAMEARVALTLRLVGGLTVAEIGRAFLVQETAMGRRITRAKAKIRTARIPYRVPSARISRRASRACSPSSSSSSTRATWRPDSARIDTCTRFAAAKIRGIERHTPGQHSARRRSSRPPPGPGHP